MGAQQELTDPPCATDECENAATYDVFWPGQEVQMCDEHKEKAERIAGVMGFALSTRALGEGSQ